MVRQIDWAAHRHSRDQVVLDRHQWVGLLDEDGVPLVDLPPLSGMEWPESRGAPADIEMILPIRLPSGRLHRVVRELIAENLGTTDEVGRLIPVDGPTRLIAMEREGMPRRVARISHVSLTGDAVAPSTMKIFASDLLTTLRMLPCPSNPLTWTGEFTRFTRDWVGPEDQLELFEHPRDLSDMKMFTVADGASVDGPSDQVIHRLVSESLDAVHRAAGITEHPPYVAVLEPPLTDPMYTIIRPSDRSIWEEVGEIALASGVGVRASLWWPGDPQPTGLTGPPLAHPTMVFSIRQEG